jgi:hypothetical protein
MRYVIKIVVVVLVAAVLVAGGRWLFISGRDVVQKISTLISEQRQLRDGWVQAEVQLRDQANMMDRILDLDSSIAASQRKTITTIGEMKMQLEAIKGGGSGQVIGDNVRRFEDSVQTIEYRLRENLFDYQLKRQAVDLVFYRPASGKWTARLEDTTGVASRMFTIGKFRVDEREPQPPPWWKKIHVGAGLGYYGTPFATGLIGYGHHNIQPIVGAAEGLKPRYGGSYIYTF